jgi:hypothetical protein
MRSENQAVNENKTTFPAAVKLSLVNADKNGNRKPRESVPLSQFHNLIVLDVEERYILYCIL